MLVINKDKNYIIAFLKSIIRNIESTELYFLLGILLSALFQRYVDQEIFASIFGGNRGLAILLAASIGVLFMYAAGELYHYYYHGLRLA